MNYDNVRTGRSIDIQARRYAENRVKDLDPEEQESEYERHLQDREEMLIQANNQQAIHAMPAAGILVTPETKDVPVVRYTLKDGVSEKQARKVIDEREALVTSVDWSGKDIDVEKIIAKAFDIHKVTLEVAVGDPKLKRNLIDALPFGSNSYGMEEMPEITSADLNSKLKEKGWAHTALAKTINVHHKIVERWTREGVPKDYLAEVRGVLS